MSSTRRWILAAFCGSQIGCVQGGAPIPTPAPVPPAAVTSPAGVAAAVAREPAQATGPARTAVLQAFVDSLVQLPQFSSAHWGMLIVSPDRADTLAEVQADRLVMPASNQKLVTAAVGLAQLGADYQWRTTFTRTGPVVRGVLRGDLVVTGTGDPSISTAMRTDPLSAFDPLIAALRSAGITRIAGRVRVSETKAFPGSPLGFGWDWDDLDAAYGAGVTELMFNEAFTDVQVRGCGAPGRLACVTTTPARASPTIRSQVTTRAAGSGPAEIEWWRDSAATPGITIRGTIAAHDSLEFSAAQPDGRATYIAAVREALARGNISVRNTAIGGSGSDTVIVLRSLPLRDVLGAMQKPSQNQIAEALFRTIAREATGVGTPDSARAVIERQLAQWGVRPDAYAVRDGSGLSRHDYISPRALVQLLETMRRSANFTTFHESLPLAGKEGTLRNRMQTVALGRVRAKTGTIDKARALSGYVTTADGEMLIFSLIANNYVVPTREVDRIAELIVERLVNMRRLAP